MSPGWQIISEPRDVIATFVSERRGAMPNPASWGQFSCLGLVRHGYLIAGVVYNNWEGTNVCAHIGAIDGKRWLIPGFLYAMFDYPFNHGGRRRITALVAKKNKPARKFVEHLGFRIEGVFPRYYARDDMIAYGMLKEKCRFIEQPEQKLKQVERMAA